MQGKIQVILKDSLNRKLEIRNNHWPLAEDLFLKWNLFPNDKNEISVKDINDITPELSAWGIPWKRTS